MEISVQNHNSTHVEVLTDTASAMLKTLLYFDVFKYPLTFNELRYYKVKVGLKNQVIFII